MEAMGTAAGLVGGKGLEWAMDREPPKSANRLGGDTLVENAFPGKKMIKSMYAPRTGHNNLSTEHLSRPPTNLCPIYLPLWSALNLVYQSILLLQ